MRVGDITQIEDESSDETTDESHAAEQTEVTAIFSSDQPSEINPISLVSEDPDSQSEEDEEFSELRLSASSGSPRKKARR